MATLPALSKVYSSRVNRPIAANTTALLVAQSNIFAMKEHLKDTATAGTFTGTRNANSVWVTKGSCDGTTVNTSGTDLLSAHTSLAWATGAHTWWWGENTTLGYQVVIDCYGASSTLLAAVAAPISTPFTGGSTTARPTSTQEFLWGTTSTGATTSVTFLSDVVTGNANVTHFICADDGQFWFLTSRPGNGIFTTVCGLQKTVGSTDTRSVFWVGSALNSGRGAMGYVSVAGSANGCVARRPDGVAVVSSGGIVRPISGGADYLGVGGTDANSGKYLAFPVDAMSLVASQYAWRGRFPDLYTVGIATVGTSIPSAAAQDRVVVGDFILPCPGPALSV